MTFLPLHSWHGKDRERDSELRAAALRTICDVLLSPLSLFTFYVALILNTGVVAGIQAVWAGIIFFTGASTGLCLGFLLETAWITLGCFSSC